MLAAAAAVTLGAGTAAASIPLQPTPPAVGPAHNDGSQANPGASLPVAGSTPVCLPGGGSSNPCLLTELLTAASS